jgi:hypothetical protein
MAILAECPMCKSKQSNKKWGLGIQHIETLSVMGYSLAFFSYFFKALFKRRLIASERELILL